MSALASSIIPTSLTAFAYDDLPEQDAAFLRDKAAYINARRQLTHQLIAEMGAALLEAKARLPGVFLAWARAEFGFSDDTIENYCKVARNMPTLPPGRSALYKARALYKLSGDNIPDSVRGEADSLAADGNTIDYETAYILADAPEPIKQRYLDESLPKATAYQLARTLNNKHLSPIVKQVCLDQQVSDPAVIQYLAEAYRDYLTTKDTIRERRTWKDIEADNWQLNGVGWSVPLSDARAVDIDRFKVDRAAMHRANAPTSYTWLRVESAVKTLPDGRVILVLDTATLKKFEGKRLLVDIRLPEANDATTKG